MTKNLKNMNFEIEIFNNKIMVVKISVAVLKNVNGELNW